MRYIKVNLNFIWNKLMSVLFHGSFGLNREYMSGIMAQALAQPSSTDKQLAQPFGYGAPFAARYRSWLHKCGVTEMGLPMKLTPFGEVVYNNDPEFKVLTTQWFLHHELVTDPERSEAWHFFALEFLPKHSYFTKEELLMGLMKKLRSHSEQHFGPGSKLNKTILNKIIEVYTGAKGLGRLGLIKSEENHFVRLNPKVPGPWKTVEALSKAYK
jgi:hypothetical protein